MRELEDGPGGFVLLDAFGRGVGGGLERIGVFEEGVFDIVEARGGSFLGAGHDGWLDGGSGVLGCC